MKIFGTIGRGIVWFSRIKLLSQTTILLVGGSMTYWLLTFTDWYSSLQAWGKALFWAFAATLIFLILISILGFFKRGKGPMISLSEAAKHIGCNTFGGWLFTLRGGKWFSYSWQEINDRAGAGEIEIIGTLPNGDFESIPAEAWGEKSFGFHLGEGEIVHKLSYGRKKWDRPRILKGDIYYYWPPSLIIKVISWLTKAKIPLNSEIVELPKVNVRQPDSPPVSICPASVGFKHLIVYSQWALGRDPEKDGFLTDVEGELRDAARNEWLSVWARQYSKPRGGFKETLNPIPAKDWENYKFDLETCMYLGDGKGTHCSITDYRSAPYKNFEDARISRDQLLQVWPEASDLRLKNDKYFPARKAFWEAHQENLEKKYGKKK